MKGRAVPCVACGRLLRGQEHSENQASQGLYFRSRGAYGSTVFDPMDGTFLEVNICDPCLADAAEKGRVLVGQDREQVVEPHYFKAAEDGMIGERVESEAEADFALPTVVGWREVTDVPLTRWKFDRVHEDCEWTPEGGGEWIRR